MKAIAFQKLLFQSAVTTMAIDGEIHDAEIEEIKAIIKQTPYFMDFEYEKELDYNISLIKESGKNAVNNFLSLIAISDLSEKQEIILIEVILRMIEADNKVDENEVKFLHMIKSKIKTTEENLLSKFPKQIEYLVDFNNYGAISSFDTDFNLG